MNADAGRPESTWPIGGGSMGALVRTNDWSRTPLGPIGNWPQSLRTAVGMMLSTRHPVFIFWGSQHVCLYNDAYAVSLGPEKHPSILGAPGREAFPEAWPIIGPQIEQVMAGGEPTWHEQHLVPISRHGRCEDVYWTYSYGPIHDADAANGVGGILVLCTETTQAVVSRRESEERYRTLVEAFDQGFCTVDLIFDEQNHPIDYVFVEVNPAFEALTGLRDAVGKSMRAMRSEHEDYWFETYGRIALTGQPARFEHRAAALGRWYAVYAFRADAERHRVAILFTDITARKRVEEELRESEARFRHLADNAPVMVWATEADGQCSYLSQTWYAFTGQTPETGLGFGWLEATHPDDREEVERQFRAATANQAPFRVEYRLRHADGDYHWAIDAAAPRFNEEGHFRGYVGSVIDITERKRAEENVRAMRDAAEQANLTKSKFLAAASHDLRQPMQSLLLFLEVLRPHVTATGQEALKHLGRGLDALRDLLDSLLDISRLDAGIVEPVVQDFAIQDFVEPISAAYMPVAAAKGIDFQVSTCSAVVRSDRTLLGRMVRNLVENALRYTESGRIAIECCQAGDRLRIEVQDTGIGIPPDQLERIWEEFHQVGNPERDRNRGLGLGLAIVQRLSDLLEHPVDVRSTPGQGSVFSIEVPRGQAEQRQAAVAAIALAGNGRFAVLVDDDAIVLLGLKATFEAWGYQVMAASSTDQALSALKAAGRRPDVVVADYRLREGRSGTEAILRVREAYGTGVPGIILTGETGSEAQYDAAAHGLHVVYKPVTARQLGETLRRLLMDDR